MTITVSKAELEEMICDHGVEVSSAPWRHGRRVTYKVEKDGVPYLVTVDVHHEEGIQLYGPTEIREAVKVTKTIETWEPKP